MFYRQNWEKVKEQHKALWKRENKKPLIAVTAPREKPVKEIKPLPVPPEIAKYNGHWYTWVLEPEFAANRGEINIARTFYGGIAIPHQLATFGPDMPAAYLGVEPQFVENTTWFRKHIIDDWSNLPEFRYDQNNKWWQLTKNLVTTLCERARGKYLVGTGCDMLSGLDTLVSLCGASRLLLDLIDYPEDVKNLTDKVAGLEIRWFDELYQITQRYQKGCVNWLGLWSEGKTYPVQCDFAHK
jgi:hypothetical protein